MFLQPVFSSASAANRGLVVASECAVRYAVPARIGFGGFARCVATIMAGGCVGDGAWWVLPLRLGRIPGTDQYSDVLRHPENKPLAGVLTCRPEASLLYLNAEYVQANILAQIKMEGAQAIGNVVCDLSTSPSMDLAGARRQAELYDTLRGRGIALTVTNPDGRVRNLSRAEGFDGKHSKHRSGHIARSGATSPLCH